jgi:TonB family protein
MNNRRFAAGLLATALLLLLMSSAVHAQDVVGTVKGLYTSAAYEEALTAIDRARASGSPPPADGRSLDEYRAFCLLALGRDADAGKAIEDLVTADPFFLPDEREVSPRVLTFVHGVRKRLLPSIAPQRYAAAKAAYERKEYAAATAQFARVIDLLGDPDIDPRMPMLADLRMLAAGFLDLAAAAAAPPKPSEPEPPPEAQVVQPLVKTVFDASDTAVVPPVAQRQNVPAWPAILQQAGTTGRPGALEVVVNETGRVEQATVRQSIVPIYDQMLLAAAVNWRYKPATLDGQPVKYRKMIQIKVDR